MTVFHLGCQIDETSGLQAAVVDFCQPETLIFVGSLGAFFTHFKSKACLFINNLENTLSYNEGSINHSQLNTVNVFMYFLPFLIALHIYKLFYVLSFSNNCIKLLLKL